jgi:hypothetical protein
MPKCQSCGHVSPPGAELCENCGARITCQDDRLPTAALAADEPVDSPASPPPVRLPGGLEGRVLAELQGGRKIAAIKIYRQQTGLGLKEAKDAVEELARRYNVAPSGGGCCAGVLLLLLLACTAVLLAAI